MCNIEVFYKKKLYFYAQAQKYKVSFGMGKCQAKDLAEHFAHTSIVALLDIILSLVKRFNVNEAIGGLF